ncbi:MAG: DUF11 domain-containing protein, partial [Gammaproteobacteria bacterium]|nr:DUF11 domain-containing protein [Gammaproteobacteria bacterium]
AIPGLPSDDYFEFPDSPDGKYEPGEEVYWVVSVQNWGEQPARDVRELNDESTVVTRYPRVESNLTNFIPLFEWPGWGCSFVGGKLVRCQPESGSFEMPPKTRILFVFRFEIAEELPRPDLDEICNEATVFWEGNRRAQNERESCFKVNSPGVPSLEVSKTIIDPATGQPMDPIAGGYEPGDVIDFRVTVKNNGEARATGINSLEDNSYTRNSDRGEVFESFVDGKATAEPAGWRCTFLPGAGRMACRTRGAPVALEPEESIEFVFRMQLADPILGKNVTQICNTAAVNWRKGPTFGRTCFAVDQQAAGF